MICEKCGSKLVVKINPKYKIPNYEHEAHLAYECEKCDNKTDNDDNKTDNDK